MSAIDRQAFCGAQSCPLIDVVDPTRLLSASSTPSIHCALQNCFGETCQSHEITKPLQCASSHRSQTFFMAANEFFNEATDFLVGDVYAESNELSRYICINSTATLRVLALVRVSVTVIRCSESIFDFTVSFFVVQYFTGLAN